MIWLVGLAVVCTSVSQFVQALAARRIRDAQSLHAASYWFALIKEPRVYLAYLLLGVGLIFWLVALTELDVSQTYPMFALGFVLTMLFARFALREEVSPRMWLGGVLIVTGSVLCNL